MWPDKVFWKKRAFKHSTVKGFDCMYISCLFSNFRLARCLFRRPAATFVLNNAKFGRFWKTARLQASSNASKNCQSLFGLLCAFVEGLAKTYYARNRHNFLWQGWSRHGFWTFFWIFLKFSMKSENPIKGNKLREFQKVAQNDHSWSALDYSRKTQTYLILSRKVQQCPLERMGVFDEVRLSRFPSGQFYENFT